MNFMIYPLGMLGFYVCGFAFMFGGVGTLSALGPGTGVLDAMYSIHIGDKTIELIGLKGFFLGPSVYDCGIFALFLFQMVFMDTTATIPTGGAAERWKFSAFMLYGCALGTILYPVYGCWVWGGGWLSHLGTTFGLGHGMVDFAGSSVVHFQGGLLSLIAAWFVGPRIGKYNKDGSVNAIPAHSVPMAVIGTFILAFGWFGFNPGSTLAGTDLRIAIVATNTMLASATGALTTVLYMWNVRGNKPDPTMACNGMLAGLVAITAPCAFVTSLSACIIGIVAGILVVEGVFFIERKMKIDDPVGSIAVHGVCGAWGVIVARPVCRRQLRRRLERRIGHRDWSILRGRLGAIDRRNRRAAGLHRVPGHRRLHRVQADRRPVWWHPRLARGRNGGPGHSRDGRSRLLRHPPRQGRGNASFALTLRE